MMSPTITIKDHPIEIIEQPTWLRFVAKILSYVFHPMFIPVMITLVLLWLQPINALILGDFKPRLLAMVFLYTGFFPAIAVFLMWRLKFIKSIQLKTRQERIIPFIVAMFFFFWVYYLSRNLGGFPLSLKQFLMGVFLSSASALFANIYTKISMHALAMGGAVGFALAQQFTDVYWQSSWTLIALLLAGAVCTARLILNAHRPVDVYAGFFVGILCQVAGFFMVGS